jgi:hypothetical protein
MWDIELPLGFKVLIGLDLKYSGDENSFAVGARDKENAQMDTYRMLPPQITDSSQHAVWAERLCGTGDPGSGSGSIMHMLLILRDPLVCVHFTISASLRTIIHE